MQRMEEFVVANYWRKRWWLRRAKGAAICLASAGLFAVTCVPDNTAMMRIVAPAIVFEGDGMEVCRWCGPMERPPGPDIWWNPGRRTPNGGEG